ncbi:MAG: c-type cytochrome [Woeseiaceae bacterium]|nr:c-type cytochrome [Woeseiaceae bacterium]
MGRLAVLFALFLTSAATAADPELLAVCAACHGEDGNKVSNQYAPVIAAIPAAHFEEAVYAYQDGARKCRDEPAMCATVSELTRDQVAALADHYSAKRRNASNDMFDPELATYGEVLHREHCARCHVLPEDEDADEALGIPLNGQRSAYLRYATYAYLRGGRATLAPAMAAKLVELTENDIEALIHYYASYRP